MADTLQGQAVRTEANPVRPDLSDIRAGESNLRIGANSVGNAELSGAFRAKVREAKRRDDLTNKAFAIDCKQSESIVSEALSGSRTLNAEWLWMQRDSFWLHLIDVVRESRGLDEAVKAEIEDRELAELFTRLIRRQRRTA